MNYNKYLCIFQEKERKRLADLEEEQRRQEEWEEEERRRQEELAREVEEELRVGNVIHCALLFDFLSAKKGKKMFFAEVTLICRHFNPSPAEPGYNLPLQTVQIQISWLLKKPTDLDLHCLPLSM